MIATPPSDVTRTSMCVKCFLAASPAPPQKEPQQKRGKGRSHQRRSRRKRARRSGRGDVKRRRREAAELLPSSKWRYPPRESTSLRWRASRRSVAERSVAVHTRLFSSFRSSLLNDLRRARCVVRKVATRSLSCLCPLTGQVRVSGEVARMVFKVSAVSVCMQVALLPTGPFPRRDRHLTGRGRAKGWPRPAHVQVFSSRLCRVNATCQRLKPAFKTPACACCWLEPPRPRPQPGPPHGHA